MKIELKKETKWNGDIFFRFFIDGVEDNYNSIYGGNIESSSKERMDELERRAFHLVDKYKESLFASKIETIYEESL